jgi:hypothetical protein
MRRTSFFITLIALLASLLFAGSALAHGAKGHVHYAADSRAEAAHNIATADAAMPTWAMATESHHGAGNTCPEAEGECCTNHCCASGGLQTLTPDLAPVFASVKNAPLSDWRPPDAASEGQLRPPCR